MSPLKHHSSFLLLSCFLLFSSIASAHNITKILEKFPDFSTFNELLSQAHLAREVNSRRTVTVLAVSNDKIGDLASKQADVIKTIMMEHIVLDYYDILKLQKIKGKAETMTTLYQTSGVASWGQGFLKVFDKKNGDIVFGSAVEGAVRDCLYLDTLTSQPYNISVLSVSKFIVAPGVDGKALSPKSSPSPKPSPPPESLSPTDVPAQGPSDAPASSPEADAPASSPEADAPASSPEADAPADGQPADKPEAPTSSAGKHLTSSTIGFLVVLASVLLAH